MADNTIKPLVPSKGLFTDVIPSRQPEGTYRYAKNAVIESDDGDMYSLSTENGNTKIVGMPLRTKIIGQTYIGDNEVLLFCITYTGLTDESSDYNSIIGKLDGLGRYTELVNDSSSTYKLNFSERYSVQSTYRLRRGNEKTIYFTDGLNKPRVISLSDLESYEDAGIFNARYLNLFTTTDQIPLYDIEVLNTGNIEKTGSYSVGIQYLDGDLNATEVLNISKPIVIIHDNSNKIWSDIRGSSNKIDINSTFGTVNKSIKVTLDKDTVDTIFPYYRLVVASSTEGNGVIDKVEVSNYYSTEQLESIYDGTQFTTITLEELQQTNISINTAKTIAQLENTLVLANTTGKNVRYCDFQKYASLIGVDCFVDTQILDQKNTPIDYKSALQNYGEVGYMPGEIYNLGIVYHFRDGTISPSYHIPGRSNNTTLLDRDEVTSVDIGTEGRVYPMSTIDNSCATTQYVSNDDEYWGVDIVGEDLLGEPLRHHRFPTREALGIPFIEEIRDPDAQEGIKIDFSWITGTYHADSLYRDDFVLTITFTAVSGKTPVQLNFDAHDMTAWGGTSVSLSSFNTIYTAGDTFSNYGYLPYVFTEVFSIQMSYRGVSESPPSSDNRYFLAFSNITSIAEAVPYISATIEGENLHTATVLGIKTSNVLLPPSLSNNPDDDVIGYQIVRSERTDVDKTVLGSGLLMPVLDKNLGYLVTGPTTPTINNWTLSGIDAGISPPKVRPDIKAFFSPEYSFLKKEITFDEISVEGIYHNESTYDSAGILVDDKTVINSQVIQDVMSGTSYDAEIASSTALKDTDGFSLHTVSQVNRVTYDEGNTVIQGAWTSTLPANYSGIDATKIFYLDSLYDEVVRTAPEDNEEHVFNVSDDNKIGIVAFDTVPTETLSARGLPYVYFKKSLTEYYTNFRYLPYFPCSEVFIIDDLSDTDNIATAVNIPTAQDPQIIFGGDTYISPLTHNSSVFYDMRLANRPLKKPIWKVIAGAVLSVIAIAAVVLAAVVSWGTLAAPALMIASVAIKFGSDLMAAGVYQKKMNTLYTEKYDRGVRASFADITTQNYFSEAPTDDEIQWVTYTNTNIWLESTVNMALRTSLTSGVSTFIDSPKTLTDTSLDINQYILDKLSTVDTERGGGRLYNGFCSAEYYNVNKDYTRNGGERLFYPLGLEYDCLSEFNEKFPHRYVYSNQSFQEELTDNYRIFLPNNYKDLEGITGEITNIFNFLGKFYIHTKESLWMSPLNYQERVTGDIVSFLGTGSLFSVPPSQVVESSSNISYGCTHPNSFVRTPNGICFINENTAQIVLFTGKDFKILSEVGEGKWFDKNLSLKANQSSLVSTGENNPYYNSPYSFLGLGYNVAYDNANKRLIFTTHDYVVDSYFTDFNGYKVFNINDVNETLFLFANYNTKVDLLETNNGQYLGIINNKMVGVKYEETTGVNIPVYTRGTTIPITYTTKPNHPSITLKFEVITEISPTLEDQNNPIDKNLSWTKSFSFLTNSWISYHDYRPDNFITTQNKLFSFQDSALYEHNTEGEFLNFYELPFNFVVELVDTASPLETKTYESVNYQTTCLQYDEDTESYVEVPDKTFDEALIYNSTQCSGDLTLLSGEEQIVAGTDFFNQRIVDPVLGVIYIQRKEKEWTLNDLRDIVINYTTPLFNKKSSTFVSDEFTDKELNTTVLDFNKEWSELQPFRDKYLIMRLTKKSTTIQKNEKLLVHFFVGYTNKSYK